MNEQKKEVTLNFTLPETKELLESGVHFGHETKRWNPKMKEYIYTTKGNIHVIDLAKTQKKLEEALKFLKSAAQKGDVIFVGTKRQACDTIEAEAMRSGSHYVVNRWAGGLLTNHVILRKSLKAFLTLEKQFASGIENRTKQEIAWMKRDYDRFVRLYEGVKHLSSKPTAVVVIDAKRENIAVREARKAGIPVVALADTNVDPDEIDYLIPGNDDAISSIQLMMKLIADAVLEGNEGKRLASIRKSYAVELEQVKHTADAEREKKRLEKEQAKKEIETLKEGSVLRISEKAPKEEPKKEVKPVIKRITPKKETVLAKEPKLSDLKLSARTEKALVEAGIDYAKVTKMSAEELKAISGVGPKSVEEILKAVAK